MQALADALNTAANIDTSNYLLTKISPTYPMDIIGLDATQFADYVADSFCSEPAISPANHSLCVIEVKDGVDVAEVKQLVFDHANPAKWVCMSAEQVLVVESGNYIMLVMSDAATCDALYQAFSDHFAGEVGEKLTRVGESSAQ